MKYFFLFLIPILFASCGNDACKEFSCLNGGYCDGDTCVCPYGYTDNDCFIRKKIEMIRITQIDITGFAQYNDFDDNWDTDAIGLPDIFPMIKDNNSTILWSGKSSTVTDAIYNNKYEFNIVPALEITAIEDIYEFILYDNDGGNEYMDGRNVAIYNGAGSFPSVLNLGYQNADFQVAIHLEYVFEN